MVEAYVGSILNVAFNFAPVGWQQAAGQMVPISQNAALFSLIGTTYGGNGVNFFNLPDLQSRVAVGAGQGAGLSPYVVGEPGGSQTVTMNIGNLPTHTHVATYSSPNLTINALTGVTAGTQTGIPAAGSQLANTYDPARGATPTAIYAPAGATGTAVNLGGATLSGGGVTNSVTGSGLPVTILPPYLTLLPIICMFGIFPTRG
jgi:microcystin-dependent protein